ncbi:hypothetical protein P7C73_g6380, partial [Tremellales sp. Uapishka_1]
MSDTREEANSVLASGLEDALGSSLASSFHPPPPAPKPVEAQASAPEISIEEATGGETAEAELEDWKPEYEANLARWQAEADVARAHAEATRKRYEDQHAAEAKRVKEEEESKKKEVRDKESAKERKERLEAELREEKHARKKAGESSGGKVKEAWELVKGHHEVVADGRGVMPQDNVDRTEMKDRQYDPTTSSDPLPPIYQDSSPPITQSRHSAVSQTWEEVSATPSSAEDLSPPASGSGLSGEEMMDVPRSSNPIGRGLTDPTPKDISPLGLSAPDNGQSQGRGQGQNQPPSQPPSLTLSVFTMPSHLSVSRVVAVLGINLLLPFINGVMLGFGEIFARETVKFGKVWWREGKSLFGGRTQRNWGESENSQAYGAGRGVASVGLSGSGGFP